MLKKIFVFDFLNHLALYRITGKYVIFPQNTASCFAFGIGLIIQQFGMLFSGVTSVISKIIRQCIGL